MKTLIIGGTGFVSGHLTDAALRAGHEVHIVTRGQRRMREGAKAIIADRHDREGFARAIEAANLRWDLAVDCIGYTADDARQDVQAILPRCDHLVFISTDFVFAPKGRPFPVDETFSLFESELPYGRGKREAELILLSDTATQPPVTILRPCHIYGPNSLLGCLPNHGRDPQLIDHMRKGETLSLVGGGYFLQQPIFAADLARMILSCHANRQAAGQIFQAAGPDVIESRRYYEIIASHLNVDARFAETSVADFLHSQPEQRSFCCHRVYSMQKARDAGLAIPATPIVEGLGQHVASMI